MPTEEHCKEEEHKQEVAKARQATHKAARGAVPGKRGGGGKRRSLPSEPLSVEVGKPLLPQAVGANL
eukprot:3035739-Lingulodinium_polyedra.AAC.1